MKYPYQNALLAKSFTRLLEYSLIQHLIDSLYICMEILEKKEILNEIMTFWGNIMKKILKLIYNR